MKSAVGGMSSARKGCMESFRRNVCYQADEYARLRVMPYATPSQLHTTRERVDCIPSLLRRLGYKKRVALFIGSRGAEAPPWRKPCPSPVRKVSRGRNGCRARRKGAIGRTRTPRTWRSMATEATTLCAVYAREGSRSRNFARLGGRGRAR